ncbi:hypothetical protein IAR55_003098 [Kwoniella newhampshirensis]|uniref:CASTOR ACT domain-containing protein n=1 Tax=Kwoniella newhampshirensis TaxID=1651941 RepID=A0AAW0Z0N6_9TREE
MSDIDITDPVAIVHIPIHLIHVYTTKIYWTIDRASEESPRFFNLTSNRIEMAIFGSLDLIMQEWSSLSDPDVLINASWRVFEISSGDDDDDDVGNYDSPHLRHVSAPLARAGISILYQSSYFTDFLLVKADDFEKAATIFAEQGWHVDHDSLPTPPRRRSQLLSPLSPSFATTTRSSPPPPAQPEITVLSSPLAFVGFSRSVEDRFSEKIRKFLVWPERALSSLPIAHQASWSRTTTLDHLDGNENVDGERAPVGTMDGLDLSVSERPFISYTRNEDGASLVTEIGILRVMFPKGGEDEIHLQSGGELGGSDGNVVQDTGARWGDISISPSDSEADFEVGVGDDENPSQESHSRLVSSDKTFPSPPLESGQIPIRWSGREVRKSDEEGQKRCLQLDLRGVGMSDGGETGGAYHLDKSGLVTRFSDLLTSTTHPIRMLYSSTFHTANILVEARDVKKAKRLLERRRKSPEWV